jgi:hypothetical protein
MGNGKLRFGKTRLTHSGQHFVAWQSVRRDRQVRQCGDGEGTQRKLPSACAWTCIQSRCQHLRERERESERERKREGDGGGGWERELVREIEWQNEMKSERKS